MRSRTLTSLLLGAAILGALLAPRLPALLHTGGDADPNSGLDPVPAPQPQRDGALTLRADLDHTVIPAGQSSVVNLVIEVSAGAARGDATRQPPVHVALVIDTSGSMIEDDRIGTARRAANALADRMRPSDSLALITFDDQAWLRLPRGPVVNPGLFHDVVAGLSPGGGTNLYDGLSRGFSELSQSGLAFNEDLRASLADAGGGRYTYADQRGELESQFLSEMDALAATVAREATLEVRLASGDQVERLYGYGADEISPDQGGFRVYLGDIGGGQRRRVVARVRLSGEPGERGEDDARTAAMAEAASAMQASAEQWAEGQVSEARDTLQRALDALSSTSTGGAPPPAMPELKQQLDELERAPDGAEARRAVIQAKEAARVYTR